MFNYSNTQGKVDESMMKDHKEKSGCLSGFKTIMKKVGALLLGTSMAFSTLTTSINVMAADGQNGNVQRNTEINPEFTIQHYFNFPAVNLKKKDEIASNKEYLNIYNTEVNGQPTNSNVNPPKYGVELMEDGQISTTKVLEQMFADEKALYFDKPQMRYMNRLYNANNGENAFNANYTLSEVWWSANSNKSHSKDKKDFTVINVPELFDEYGNKVVTSGGTVRHDPSKVIFTNNPDYSEIDSTEKRVQIKKDSSGNPIPTEINGKWVVPITEGSLIRLSFAGIYNILIAISLISPYL